MKKFYPEETVYVIGPKEYREISKKMGAMIPYWEKEGPK